MASRRRRRQGWIEEGAPIALSFLDIVSAGFGGAIFLLVIFATLPIAELQGGGGGGTRFIDLYLNWDTLNESGKQVEALVELQIEHLDTGQVRRRIRLGKPGARIVPETDALVTADRQKAPWKTALVMGFDWDGAYAPTESPRTRYLHARIIEPADGEWFFFANVYRFQCWTLEGTRMSATECGPEERGLKMTGQLSCSSSNELFLLDKMVSGNPNSPPDALFNETEAPCIFVEPE